MKFGGNLGMQPNLAALTATGYTVGFTSNAKTASASITIANGNSITAAETANAVVSLAAQIAALKADLAAIRTALNE